MAKSSPASISHAKLGSPQNPVHIYKNWWTVCAEWSSYLTFIMVTIIFWTGVALAVQLAGTVSRVQDVVQKLIDYVEWFIQLLKDEGAKIKQILQEQQIPQRLEQAAEGLENLVVNELSNVLPGDARRIGNGGRREKSRVGQILQR